MYEAELPPGPGLISPRASSSVLMLAGILLVVFLLLLSTDLRAPARMAADSEP
jgi:hypothetical protein